LNGVPFIEVVDRRELRWFGHLIGTDNNRNHRDLWDAGLRECGKKKRKDRMGIAIVEVDEGKRRRICCKIIGWGSTGKHSKSG
jgi:hypothetical protein